MAESVRISISLKVDTGEETYWGLMKPLQDNRQLSAFIMTCLRAYIEDSDIHDSIDNFKRRGSDIDAIRAHVEELMRLQAQANRVSDDIRTSLGGESENEIENIFEEQDKEDGVQVDDYEAKDVVPPPTTAIPSPTRQVVKPVVKSDDNAVLALPSNAEPVLNRIVQRLDTLEKTVGSLSSMVDNNAVHISQIEGRPKGGVESMATPKEVQEVSTTQAVSKVTRMKKAEATKQAVSKSVRQPVPDIKDEVGTAVTPVDGDVDLEAFINSVS